MQISNIKKQVSFQVLIVLFLTVMGVIAPYTYHIFGLTGAEFLPIFLVLSISAYRCNPIQLYAIAILIPLANHIFTGMPAYTPIPALQYLIFEGLVFSTIITFLRSSKIHFAFVLIGGLIIARCSSIVFVLLYSNFTFDLWINIILRGLPGVLLNSIAGCIIPVVFKKG